MKEVEIEINKKVQDLKPKKAPAADIEVEDQHKFDKFNKAIAEDEAKEEAAEAKAAAKKAAVKPNPVLKATK